jgi:hypothetical protein
MSRIEVNLARGSRPPLSDRAQKILDNFIPRFRAEVALTVDADANSVGLHVAFSDHEHGVDFHLLGALDLAVDVVGTGVELGADLLCAQLG